MTLKQMSCKAQRFLVGFARENTRLARILCRVRLNRHKKADK